MLPESVEKISSVLRFKEKPSEEEAEKLIKEGALWNAGVFACRLDYLLKRAERVFGNSSYNYLVQHYPELKAMYSADDDNTEVLYFKNATATISSFAGALQVIKF